MATNGSATNFLAVKNPSSILKEIVLMLRLAKEVKEESIFQQNAQYKKFKAKKNGHRSEIMGWIDILNHDLEFRNECVFWCHKFFQERVCDKDEKCRVFHALSSSYYKIEDYEKTIEFGQKCLDIHSQIEKPCFDVGSIVRLVYGMIESSRKLERDEDLMKYLKEKLKLDVLRFNDGKITTLNLLAMYGDLIYVQVKTKNFEHALKTLKSLTLFSVNSKDPLNDVVQSMERHGYKKHFPLSLLYIDFDITEKYGDFSKLVVKHYTKLSEQDKRESVKMIEVFYHLARICLFKCEILQNLGDRDNCEKWAYLHFLMAYDIQFHMRLIESVGVNFDGGTMSSDSALCETIAAALRLSFYDPLKRAKLFDDLYPAILGRDKTVGYYLSKTSREYDLSFEHLMPFITFCIENFDDFDWHDEPCWSKLDEGKNSEEKLISYKNSLININHFRTKLQPNSVLDESGNEDIKFEVFHDVKMHKP